MLLTRRAAAFALPLLALAGPARAAPAPPRQPPDGPGGARTLYPAADRHDLGSGAEAAAVFTPQGAASAPVVVFLHAWGATDPLLYGAWIEHICRRGRIVICPAYQDSLTTPAVRFARNAAAATRDAMARLQAGAFGVRPESEHGAYLGHAMGGALAARLACDAAAAGAGLPRPLAVMCVEPAVGPGPDAVPAAARLILGDLSRMPQGTLLVTVTGDRDTQAGDTDARRIWLGSVHVKDEDKAYVVLHSDDRGAPALVADHAAPLAPAPGATLGLLGRHAKGPVWRVADRARDAVGALDALDWYGAWKLFDGLTDAAFYGFNRGYALGGGPDQTFMGLWSDGVPVRRLSVLTPEPQSTTPRR